jgi:hypothetical protein
MLYEVGANELHFLSTCREVQDIVLVRRLVATDTNVAYVLVRIKPHLALVAMWLQADCHFVHPIGDESVVSFLASIEEALLRTTAEPLDD